jgi:hypothetical protein
MRLRHRTLEFSYSVGRGPMVHPTPGWLSGSQWLRVGVPPGGYSEPEGGGDERVAQHCMHERGGGSRARHAVANARECKHSKQGRP